MSELNKQHLEAVTDMLENMESVKGESFTKMVRFVGIVQAYTKLNIGMLVEAGVPEEDMEQYSKRAALFACALCHAYGKVIGVKNEDLDEVLTMVDQVDERIGKVFNK